MAWNNYSAYEIRIIGALVRLGRRRDALEVMEFMLADRRIPVWNQWPEISWRDPSGPSFIGDLPHTWISAEYILAICACSPTSGRRMHPWSLPREWRRSGLSDGSAVGVENLPTHYGNLTYSLRLKSKDTLRLRLKGDLAVPPGGIVVSAAPAPSDPAGEDQRQSPLRFQLRQLHVQGMSRTGCGKVLIFHSIRRQIQPSRIWRKLGGIPDWDLKGEDQQNRLLTPNLAGVAFMRSAGVSRRVMEKLRNALPSEPIPRHTATPGWDPTIGTSIDGTKG